MVCFHYSVNKIANRKFINVMKFKPGMSGLSFAKCEMTLGNLWVFD